MNHSCRYILFLLFTLVTLTVTAQKSTLDSLLQANKRVVNDTNKVKTLNALVKAYGGIAPDSSLFYAQQALELSKKIKWKKGIADSWHNLGYSNYLLSNHDEALKSWNKSIELKKEIDDQKGIASSLGNIGLVYWVRSDDSTAMAYFTEAINIHEKLGAKKEMSLNIGNIGLIYWNQGNYSKALEYYFKALRLGEELKDDNVIAINTGNIGIIYQELAEYDKALTYFEKGITINEKLNDQSGVAINLVNIGTVYNAQNKYNKAYDIFQKSLIISEKIGHKNLIASNCSNLAIILKEFAISDTTKPRVKDSLFKESLQLDLRALAIAEEIGDINGKATYYANLGVLYFHMNNIQIAEKYLTDAAKIASEIGALDLTSTIEETLSQIYAKTGRFKLAYEHYLIHISAKDSIYNDQNKKSVLSREIQYNYDRKAAEDSIIFARQNEIDKIALQKQDAELKAKRTESFALYGGLILFVLFSLFLYNRFTVTKKQRDIINEQKTEVEVQRKLTEEKNKEILDSITYAKRIQNAILPSDQLIKKLLPESFVYYKPKDIVAGDFYWIQSFAKTSNSIEGPKLTEPIEGNNKTKLTEHVEGNATEPASKSKASAKDIEGNDAQKVTELVEGTANDIILFAAADCTGHGVPGAMVSVVCNNALNRSVKEFGLSDPGKILDKTREIVINEFEKSDEDVKDGMDIALCSYSRTTKKLIYAGANNPLWIIRGTDSSIEEIKANKQPIGKYEASVPFQSHTLQLNSGDSIYIFTDGYQDQFGGDSGKKFKASSLKSLLISIHKLPMREQQEIINKDFEKWKGNLEQIDDVCVIGVRV